jgi:hypothetical protein
MITCSEIPIPPGYASNMNICHMAPHHATENKVKQEVFSSQVYVYLSLCFSSSYNEVGKPTFM